MDGIEIALIVMAACIIGLILFLITGRLIGWALGIGEVRAKNEVQIEQNNQILDAIATLIEIQKATLINQGGTLPEEQQE